MLSISKRKTLWFHTFLLMLLFSIVAAAAEAPVPELEVLPGGDRPNTLTWNRRSGFCFSQKDFLIIDVPPKSKWGANWFETTVNLKPYRNQEMVFFIRYRSFDVSTPSKGWNGFKFMLVLTQDPPDGPKIHPACNRPAGTTDGWKSAAFSVKLGPAVEKGTLCLGLQDVSGKVEFDLSSLRIGLDPSHNTVFTPPPLVNQDFRIAYRSGEINPERTRFRGVMSPLRRLTPQDIMVLAEWHANIVRYQLNRNFGKVGTDIDIDDYNRWLDRRLDEMEEDLKLASKHGIRFVVDLHTTPGGRQAYYETRCLYDRKYAEEFIRVWERIARRFQGCKGIYAYDLINEPLQTMPAPFDSCELQRRAIEAIRKIDPDTPIMFQASNQTWDYRHISPYRIDNVIYSFHMYKPGSYTHQRLDGAATPVLSYPGKIDGEIYDKEKLREWVQPMRDFQLRHHAKIFVGEFSAIAWAPGAEKYLADCISIFEEYGWDWTYHAFREWDAWSVEHAGTSGKDLKLEQDTPRKRVLLDALRKNGEE